MPSLNGLEATRQILRLNPQTKVLILTLHDSDQVVREVLNAGARGFLLKSDAARDLVAAVEALRRDKTYFTSKVAAMVLEGYLKNGTPSAAPVPPSRSRLTPREREIVQLLAEGKSTKEVAVALGLSVKTAETHRSNIMRKLELHPVNPSAVWCVSFLPSADSGPRAGRTGSRRFRSWGSSSSSNSSEAHTRRRCHST